MPVMSRSALPLLVTVNVCEAAGAAPTLWFPKSNGLAGVTWIDGAGTGVPVPVRFTWSGPAESLFSVRVAE